LAAKIDLQHKVHVLTKKEELDSVRLPGKVVVVLDIIFATTTMVAALDWSETRSEWAIAYRFDLVLRGRRRTHFDEGPDA